MWPKVIAVKRAQAGTNCIKWRKRPPPTSMTLPTARGVGIVTVMGEIACELTHGLALLVQFDQLVLGQLAAPSISTSRRYKRVQLSPWPHQVKVRNGCPRHSIADRSATQISGPSPDLRKSPTKALALDLANHPCGPWRSSSGPCMPQPHPSPHRVGTRVLFRMIGGSESCCMLPKE